MTTIKKYTVLPAADQEVVSQIIDLTLESKLIPEADLQMLSAGSADFTKLKILKEKCASDSLSDVDFSRIANLIAHNIMYPHINMAEMYELLGKDDDYLPSLYRSLSEVSPDPD